MWLEPLFVRVRSAARIGDENGQSVPRPPETQPGVPVVGVCVRRSCSKRTRGARSSGQLGVVCHTPVTFVYLPIVQLVQSPDTAAEDERWQVREDDGEEERLGHRGWLWTGRRRSSK